MDLQILATSDTHGRFVPWNYETNCTDSFGSAAQQAAAIKKLRTDATLVVDAGDTVQGNSAELFLHDDIHPMIAAQNAIGYDVCVIGNHEFDYGCEVLGGIIAEQKAKILCGNIYNPDGEPFADGYTVIEKCGVKIGVIGMVTPNITRWNAQQLNGWQVTNPVAESSKIIKTLKGKVDVLVGVMHMDINNEYGVYGSGVADLANACPEFDVIIAAHGHRDVPGEIINGVLVAENRDVGATLSEIHLNIEQADNGNWKVKSKKSRNLRMIDYEPDEAVAAMLAACDARAKADAVAVIGELRGEDLAPENEISFLPQPLIQDTALLDFVSEAYTYYTGADVAAAALSSMTSQIKKGTIRKCDLSTYIYQTTLCKLQMEGWQLRRYMEWSASMFKRWKKQDVTIAFNPWANFYLLDAFAGVKYEIDISQREGERIKNLTWQNGVPVQDSDTFTIAVSRYRAVTQLLVYADVFKQDEKLPTLLEEDVRNDIGGIKDLLCDYIRSVKGGVIYNHLNNNWRIIGNDWDAACHKKAVQLLQEGKLPLSRNAQTRTLPYSAVTLDEITDKS